MRLSRDQKYMFGLLAFCSSPFLYVTRTFWKMHEHTSHKKRTILSSCLRK
nr:MAG TPA: hypothetical protein [Caudoviricetes sp.]